MCLLCASVCLHTWYSLVTPLPPCQLIRTLSAGDVDLAEQLMNYLLGRQVDVSYVVRMICIQGLGNMADIKGSQVRGRRTFVGRLWNTCRRNVSTLLFPSLPLSQPFFHLC